MSEAVAAALPARPNLNTRPHVAGGVIFIVLLAIGIGYTLNGLLADIDAAHTPPVAIGAFVLLGIALLIALGFEFVNGFHDTANAVATVIYTHSLPPHAAVVWSGAFNFLGVMVSSGAVAFSVLSLLPVELILQVGGSAGFAMIFALLIAAIVWNLGTWWLGLPASSSHTLIGSIIGVGLANQFMAPVGVRHVGCGLVAGHGRVPRAAVQSGGGLRASRRCMLLVMKLVIRNKALYAAPTSDRPPPAWIRGLLILTCTGVSFAHGSNDGQKGMGLIMLILIGSVPTAFALNHAMPSSATPAFYQATEGRRRYSPRMRRRDGAVGRRGAARSPRRCRRPDRPDSRRPGPRSTRWPATSPRRCGHGEMNAIPAAAVPNVRNDMYLVSEAIRLAQKARIRPGRRCGSDEAEVRGAVDSATKFIRPG